MFAVNGPSGPTSRNERRVKSTQQREAEEDTKRQWDEKKREQFFLEKRGSDKRDKEKAKECPVQSSIFKGCRIVFNGRTGKVSSYYLAKLVQEHGGNVASMMTSTRITHMIGSNLNGSKADKVLKSSGKVKFVSPEWILQSVKHKKRQPEFEFLVYKDSVAAGSLRTAFSLAASSSN